MRQGEAAWVGQRLRALFVDLVLWQVVGLPGELLERAVPGSGGRLLEALLRAGFLIWSGYLLATTGQSLGKRFHRIRVVATGDRPPGFVRGVLLRNVACVAILVAGVVLLGLVDADERVPPEHLLALLVLLDCAPIFGPGRRCLHDYLAGTRVVRVSVAEVFA